MKKIFLISFFAIFFLSGCEVVNNISRVEFDISDVSTAITNVVNKVDNGVVGVQAQSGSVGSTGSGSIINKEGNTYTVLTNNHVVVDENGKVYDSFSIMTTSKNLYESTLVKRNAGDDMAILTFTTTSEYDVLEIANDEDVLTRGEFVVAIGSPLGFNHFNTVTLGVISQISVDMTEANMSSKMVQHDAAINSGNSGGPLFNLKGKIIGMNTLKYEKTPTGSTVIGMYFAVSHETLNKFVA